MSSEAHVKSFYLNVPTRPKISKLKVQDQKKWDTSLRDFNENKEPFSFPSSESNAFYEKLCEKKIIEIPKKIFYENARKSLKRKPISEKNIIETDLLCLNNQPNCSFSSDKNVKKTIRNSDFNIHAIQATFEKRAQNVRCDSKSKFEQMQCVFSENAHKSLKRKSIFQKSTIDTDFTCLNSQTNPLCSFSFVQPPQTEKRICPLQNTNFNFCNIEATCEKKTLSVRCTDVLKQYAVYEHARDVKKPIPKHNFIIPEEFSPDNSEALSRTDSFLNISTPGSGGFKTIGSFKEVKHKAVKVEPQEDRKNLFKTDLISTLSVKCNGSSTGVGSDWVHSLEQIQEGHAHNEGKKKIQNLLAGGYCEQILKFQRRELSEKAICEHRNGLKTASETALMRINSIIHEYEIVVAECCLLDKSNDPELKEQVVLNESLTYIALFQKSSFYKQQMKTGKSFLLSPPWHLIRLKTFKNPIIICKYFKAATMSQIQQKLSFNEKLKENTMKFQNLELEQCDSVVEASKMSKISTKTKQKEDTFFVWKKRVNIYAKIQRIWNHRISLGLQNDQNIYRRLTLLLQTRNGDFYLLTTSSHHYLYKDWFKSVQSNEGHFYFFENLNVLHRLEKKRYPRLFKYLQNLSKESKVTEVEQNFVYQLGIDGMTKKPSRIIEADLPPFLSFNFLHLSTVMKCPTSRASCKAKVLLHYGSVVYISDDSIFHLGNMQYVKVFLPQPPASTFSNSGICITEALILEGNLYLDEYSQISYFPLSKEALSTLHLRNAELSLRQDSKVADIVTVKGNITNVDENNACIWLQCSFCLNENLVQNSEEIIFCENCCLVVPQPLLKVKMSVTVASQSLPNNLLNIELLSHTIKRVLSLKENSYQPQCNVSDVLGREIGPLLCYVRGVDFLETHRIFYLNEVED